RQRETAPRDRARGNKPRKVEAQWREGADKSLEPASREDVHLPVQQPPLSHSSPTATMSGATSARANSPTASRSRPASRSRLRVFTPVIRIHDRMPAMLPLGREKERLPPNPTSTLYLARFLPVASRRGRKRPMGRASFNERETILPSNSRPPDQRMTGVGISSALGLDPARASLNGHPQRPEVTATSPTRARAVAGWFQ